MSYRLRPPRKGRSEYWSAIITTPEGVTSERSTRCVRKAEARAVAERWDRDAALSRHQVALVAALESLRAHKVDQRCSDSTLEFLDLKGSHLITFFGAERPVDTIKLADTVAYVRHRRAGTETRAGVCDATAALELKELRAALRWLRRNGLYDGEPAAIWPGDVLQASAKRKRWLPIKEFQKLWLAIGGYKTYSRRQRFGAGRHGGKEQRVQVIETNALLGQDWRDHLTVYCYAGLRLSELYRVEAGHIDGDHLDVPGTKTEGAARRVPLSAEALEVLSRRAATHETGPLFPMTSPNWKAQKKAWHRALKAACRRAQIGTASTNDLRRTFCSWCYQGDVPESVTVRWMGHSSNTMVRDVYAQGSDEHGREHITRLPSAGNLPRISPNHRSIGATSGNRGQRKHE